MGGAATQSAKQEDVKVCGRTKVGLIAVNVVPQKLDRVCVCVFVVSSFYPILNVFLTNPLTCIFTHMDIKLC